MRMILLVVMLGTAAGSYAEEDAGTLVMDASTITVASPDPLALPSMPAPPSPGMGDPNSPQFMVAAVKLFTHAVRNKQYAIAAAFLLMAFAWVLRKMFPRVPPKFVPLVTLFLASVPALVVVLNNPAVTLEDVLGALLAIWFMSAGAWENAIKAARDGIPAVLAWASKLLPAKAPEPAPQAVPEPVVVNVDPSEKPKA